MEKQIISWLKSFSQFIFSISDILVEMFLFSYVAVFYKTQHQAETNAFHIKLCLLCRLNSSIVERSCITAKGRYFHIPNPPPIC